MNILTGLFEVSRPPNFFLQKNTTLSWQGAAALDRTFTKTLAQSRLKVVLFHLRNCVKIIILALILALLELVPLEKNLCLDN